MAAPDSSDPAVPTAPATGGPIVHPIAPGWVSTGGTGAQNYDEFADDAEITAVVEANPRSALGVEMPQWAPDSLGSSFADALPAAVRRLGEAEEAGAYRAVDAVVAAYRISARDGRVSHGLFAMVDTDQISTGAHEPGRVIRNEDVFAEKVAERVALIGATHRLLSAVLLLQTDGADELERALREIWAGIEASDGGPTDGEPTDGGADDAGALALRIDVADLDTAGRRHEIALVSDPGTVQRLCRLAGDGELVVADGNHRTLAAQTAGLDRFLAVVTTPQAVDLLPYHRLIASWPEPAHGGAFDPVGALLEAGAEVHPLGGDAEVPEHAGVIHLHTADGEYAVRLPVPAGAEGVDALDHAVVEQVLVREVLGWEPGDKRISYVGGDYPASWLREKVDEGRAVAAVLIAPVRVDDFVRVNLAREKMPRKSTWFTPKVRAGLVLAGVGA